MKTKASQHNVFLRIITTPFRALCKARDFYVNTMINCANRNVVGLKGSSQASSLPRSFSVGSARSDDSEDFRELVRAVSARSRVDLDTYIRHDDRLKMRAGPGIGGPRALPPRSISVAMGRIDEESPCCYFGEDINGKNVVNMKNELMYPRSKSHAVARIAF